jgi:hypothetical protein
MRVGDFVSLIIFLAVAGLADCRPDGMAFVLIAARVFEILRAGFAVPLTGPRGLSGIRSESLAWPFSHRELASPREREAAGDEAVPLNAASDA